MKTAAQDYLKRLRHELRGLDPQQRQEILDEVRAHIDESLIGTGESSEANVHNVLDRLGDPADIAREAYARFDTERASATLSISRSTARRVLLVAAFTFLLAPRGYILLMIGPSFGSTAGDRVLFSNVLQEFLMALVPAAFMVVVMIQPRKMIASYWFVPAYFAVSGLAYIVRGALLLFDPVLSPRSVYGFLAMGFVSVCLGLLIWLVRPIDSETDGRRPQGVASGAGEAAPA